MTQGAISRQVKKLELHLGAALFLRDINRVELTEYAKAILPATTLAFENISQSIEAASSARSVIRLQVAPTFAVRWLLPRLADFAEQHGQIDVRPSITLHPEGFDQSSFDAGIIYGDGSWPSLHATLLSEEVLLPVCAPQLIADKGAIEQVSDLDGHVLLHTTTDRRDWPIWLNEVGARDVNGYDGPAFETLDMAVRAAEAGIGIAIGDLSLIGDDLRDGKLVVPIKQQCRTGRGTYFVCPSDRRSQSGLSIFRNWLLANAPVRQPEPAWA